MHKDRYEMYLEIVAEIEGKAPLQGHTRHAKLQCNLLGFVCCAKLAIVV